MVAREVVGVGVMGPALFVGNATREVVGIGALFSQVIAAVGTLRRMLLLGAG